MKLQFKLFLPYLSLKDKIVKVIRDTGHGISPNTVFTISEARINISSDELQLLSHPSWGTRNIPLSDIIFTNITLKDLEKINKELENKQKLLKSQITYMEKNNLTEINPQKFFEDYINSILQNSTLSDQEKTRQLLVYMRQ